MSAVVISIVDRLNQRRVSASLPVPEPATTVTNPVRVTEGSPGAIYTDLDVARWCLLNGHLLSFNQLDFIETICLSLNHRPLTPRQFEWLEGIVKRLNSALSSNGGDAA